MNKMRRHALFAVLTGAAVRLFFVLRFPSDAGDSALYEELARNWLVHRIYGLNVTGQLMPTDVRAPGYPAFLAAIFALCRHGRIAVMLVQAAVDLGTCFLTAALAARLAPKPVRPRVWLAALWLAATCPFVANYAAVPLTEVLATFLTAAALLLLVHAATGEETDPDSVERSAMVAPNWFLGGAVVGLGTLVRPETPLLLAGVALVLIVRWGRRADWSKLLRAGTLIALGLVLPLMPWAARNWRALHKVQFLAPRYAEMKGEIVPHGFNAWTRTWLVRFRDVYVTMWRLEDEPLRIEELPDSAFDTPEERVRVAALFDRYNEALNVSPEWDAEFAALSRERTARHRLRTYIRVPLGRVVTLWLTPRIELLPFSGHLWPLGKKWDDDPMDFSVTVGFFALNCFYVVLAGAGFWLALRRRDAAPAMGAGTNLSPERLALALLVAFILLRTAYLTTIETPEPRYVLECFPALLALAAPVWSKSKTTRDHDS